MARNGCKRCSASTRSSRCTSWSRPVPHRGIAPDLVTDAIARDWRSLEGFRAYLCGAPPMVEATALLVRQMGVLPEQVYADAFYASGT